jgi:large subunit ribosomal protein L23
MYYVIKRPLVTEKNSVLAEQGVYAFEVEKKATKAEIKQAVEKFFRVKVASVNTAMCRGRSKRTQKYGVVRPESWKKAMVRLRKGEKISLFEGA